MKNFKDLFNEPTNAAFKNRVMAQARTELAAHKISRFDFLKKLSFGTAFAAIAAYYSFKSVETESGNDEFLAAEQIDIFEEAEDLDLLTELDIIEAFADEEES